MAIRFSALEADIRQAEVIDQYKVGMATVYITSDCRYLIQEPHLSREAYAIYSKLEDRMDTFLQSLGDIRTDPERMHELEGRIWKEAQKTRQADRVSDFFGVLKYFIMRNKAGYGLLDVLVNDDQVDEIFVEGRGIEVAVSHRRHQEFGLLETNIVIGDVIGTSLLVSNLLRKIGKTVVTKPVTEGITDQKHRVTITYGNAIPANGPAITISKFQAKSYSVTDLLRLGTISRLEAAYLWMLNDAGAFGLVAGDAGSGKTTMLNSIGTMSNPRWRVITIEDVRRLHIPHRHVLAFDVWPLDDHERLLQLVRASRWMRPDLLMVDDVQEEEAREVFRSAQNGHAVLASMNCHDIDSLLCRLGADPIGIKPAMQAILWYAVLMDRFRSPQGRYVRRIRSIMEFDPANCVPSRTDLFSGNAKAMEGPESIEDLLRKSKLVRHAAEILGVNPEADLQARIKLLDECLEKNAGKVHDVFEILKKHYRPNRIRIADQK
ncbi:MAG: type II/IV secretion system ATPase subunit [Thaumarchaeota archaeon]|nr:type II/IV secretion system ATPase subunit [Nitrososphaerota archaeon]